MTRAIAISIATEVDEERIPIRMVSAARTFRSVPLTYFALEQPVTVHVVR